MNERNIDLPGRFAVYGTAGGKLAVATRFEGKDIRLTKKQAAGI